MPMMHRKAVFMASEMNDTEFDFNKVVAAKAPL